MTALVTSQRGVRFISSWEQFRSAPYYDLNGYPTNGFGHLLSVIKYDDLNKWPLITLSQGIDQLAIDLVDRENAVNTLSDGCSQTQFDALVSLVFNIGASAFTRSTILAVHRGNVKNVTVQEAFLMWNKVIENGVLVSSPGLTRRRQAECDIYETGIYRGSDNQVIA